MFKICRCEIIKNIKSFCCLERSLIHLFVVVYDYKTLYFIPPILPNFFLFSNFRPVEVTSVLLASLITFDYLPKLQCSINRHILSSRITFNFCAFFNLPYSQCSLSVSPPVITSVLVVILLCLVRNYWKTMTDINGRSYFTYHIDHSKMHNGVSWFMQLVYDLAGNNMKL